MAGTPDFSFTVGFLANTKALTESIRAFSGDLTNNPLKLSAVLPDLKTDAAQKGLDAIKAQATAIEDVTVKTQTMKTASGQAYTEITGLVVRYRDALNLVRTAQVGVDGSLKDVTKNVTKFDAMAKKAQEWATRAETMGEKERTALQSTTSALLAKVDGYKKMAAQDPVRAEKELAEGVLQANAAMNETINSTKRGAMGLRSWTDQLGLAIKQTITYSFTLGLVRQAQRLFNEAIQYTINLNKEMTNVQVLQAEGAQTPEEIRSLALAFNQLGKEMGISTLEVAKGSVEWLRQGKSIAETQELLRASTMLSKLGAISAAESTEYLTSTLNSYKMSSEEAVSVVDRLIAVDNVSATSSAELATALRYTAAAAADAGVNIEQLISYIAVISSTTRLNAEQIGQAMKTIFTRMQDIKAGAVDEDGLGLNNVESALARVDIKLRDSETSFRDMGLVL